jgi:hypothetical protein
MQLYVNIQNMQIYVMYADICNLYADIFNYMQIYALSTCKWGNICIYM